MNKSVLSYLRFPANLTRTNRDHSQTGPTSLVIAFVVLVFLNWLSPPVYGACSFTQTVPPGWSLIGNACANDNTVGALMPNAPLGTRLLKWDPAAGTWSLNLRATTFAPGWTDPLQVIRAGEGAFVFNPTAASFAVTFTGPAPPPALPLTWATNSFLACRQADAPAGYEGIVGSPPPEGTIVYRSNATGGWDVYQFTLGIWDPVEPQPAVGESVWVCLQGSPPAFPDICGYTLPVPSGWSAIANQCSNNNQVVGLFPTVPVGTEVWKYDNVTRRWSINIYESTGWSCPTQTLAPSEGAFIKNPAAAFDVAMGGWPNTPHLPLVGCTTPGCYLVSCQTPDLADYEDIMGCAPVDGVMVYRFRPGLGAYDVYVYEFGAWDPMAPVAAVGESVWVWSEGAPPPVFGCPVTIALTVTITWPCDCCHLEQTTSLVQPNWTPVPGTSPIALPVTATAQFFRVVCP